MRETQGTGFIDTNTLCLRQSPSFRVLNLKNTITNDSKELDLSIGLLSVAIYTTKVIQQQFHQCYHACKVNYYEYIRSNFDGTLNRISIIDQILSAELSNECYMLKEMMRQPNRTDFEADMCNEVKHMFDNQVWNKVTRIEILEYYRNLQRQGVDMKRE
eukprot:12727319-Ditylum_brightwellii.AAC.1